MADADEIRASHTGSPPDGSPAARHITTHRTPPRDRYDAIVIGSGPNGLTAANVIAQTGRRVLVVEAAPAIGGGTRTEPLTLDGFLHDVCSAIHPLAVVSPAFQELDLERYGLEWIHPPLPVVHPLHGDRAVVVEHDLERTAAGLDSDGRSYLACLKPFVEQASTLLGNVLGPIRWPRQPGLMLRFARHGFPSAAHFVRKHFAQEAAPAMFAGMAAHSVLPLERRMTAGVGLMFCLTAHTTGWPLPQGGSQSIANALALRLLEHGGDIVTSLPVASLDELPSAKAILFDTNPGQLSRIAGDALPPRFRRTLERFRHGPGVFKIDWALDGPIPWLAESCYRAGTVHLGGPFDEVAASERAAWQNQACPRPFVLIAQTSLFDDRRAPSGKHTAWAYCHVPHGSNMDATEHIEQRIEQFAPGFRDRILARHTISPAALHERNPNCVGGDITGGVMDVWQFVARPTLRWNPYSTPNPRLFLCSASTPPGAGVHGMCGYHAAQSALRGVLRD